MSATSKLEGIRPDDHRYDGIIDLPHHISATRPHMPIGNRAAQFSPFAALSGHDAAIKETARLTERRIELDEGRKEVLAEKLRIAQEQIEARPEITITYFRPDKKKKGGAYVEATGTVKKIDEYERQIVMEDGTAIPIDEVFEIEGELLRLMDVPDSQ